MEQTMQNIAGEAAVPPQALSECNPEALDYLTQGGQMSQEEIAARLLDLETAFGMSSAEFERHTSAGEDLSGYTYGGESLSLSPLRVAWLVLLGAPMQTKAGTIPVPDATVTWPRPGDLFTNDYVSFHRVSNPEDLTAQRANLVLHIPPDVDWKTAVWAYLQDGDKSTQVWDANGIPTTVGPAD